MAIPPGHHRFTTRHVRRLVARVRCAIAEDRSVFASVRSPIAAVRRNFAQDQRVFARVGGSIARVLRAPDADQAAPLRGQTRFAPVARPFARIQGPMAFVQRESHARGIASLRARSALDRGESVSFARETPWGACERAWDVGDGPLDRCDIPSHAGDGACDIPPPISKPCDLDLGRVQSPYPAVRTAVELTSRAGVGSGAWTEGGDGFTGVLRASEGATERREGQRRSRARRCGPRSILSNCGCHRPNGGRRWRITGGARVDRD
jgi:hypothetical protein